MTGSLNLVQLPPAYLVEPPTGKSAQRVYSYIDWPQDLQENHLFSATYPGRKRHSMEDITRPSKGLETYQSNSLNLQDDRVSFKERIIDNNMKARTHSYSRIPNIAGEYVSEVNRNEASIHVRISDKMTKDMDERSKISQIDTQESISSTSRISNALNRPDSSSLRTNPRNTSTTYTYFTEDKLGIYRAEEKGIINSHYLNILRARSFNHAVALAKTHINLYVGMPSNSLQEKKDLQRSNKILEPHHTGNTINDVDEFIRKLFKRTILTLNKKYDLGRPLAFLSSVAHVKIDILSELRDEI